MYTMQTPRIKDLVLIGGGHSHVAVLKRFGMQPLSGVRLTVISRDVHTPYSGMLPGFIAGHYDYQAMHIDLEPLSRFAGARLYHDEVIGLNPGKRTLQCRHHPDIGYDVLSLDIGSTPHFAQITGAAQVVVPVKPISNFIQRWERLVERVLSTPGTTRIGIVGAGAGGVELTLAVQFRLRHLLQQAGRPDTLKYHLFSSHATILHTHNRHVQVKFRHVLSDRGVQVHENCRVVAVHQDGLSCADGSEYALDEILWVTDASAPDWLGKAGLAVDERGFVQVNAALQSISHPEVFAAGDIAAVVPYPREKAGVFAVRQGKPLAQNLRHVLAGRHPHPFVPQKQWLALISTGDKYAVASRGHWFAAGRWVWRLKDWIDRRFMNAYNVLPERPPAVSG